MRTLIIISTIVLLVACNGSEAGNEAQEAQQYELLTIQQSDFEYNTVYSATVRGLNDIAILPKIEGYIYGIKGKAESISGIIDDKTGSVSVCAIFDNPNGVLLSGMTAKVVITNSMKSAIVIPQESAYQILDKVYVMKVIDGKATASIIKTAPQNNGTQYIVEEGLTTGDVIIAKGASFVEEGTEVETIFTTISVPHF